MEDMLSAWPTPRPCRDGNRARALHPRDHPRTLNPVNALPSLNVLSGPLKPCSLNPLTGFFRNGQCDTCAEDQGCHTVCVEVTSDFLIYSSATGNDLSTPRPEYDFPGLQPGDRWCVCASRWLEALEAGVPAPVALASTHFRSLEVIPLSLLQQHATA